jgi:hypothetical protein
MSLDDVKRRLSQKYLGKAGVHGIGLSRAQNAVKVHLESNGNSEQDGDQSALLEELKREAAPYDVLITVEEKATKSD